MPGKPLQVGDAAPDFELRDQHKQPVRLSDYRGKRNVVVVFLPFAFSRVCTRELCALRDDFADLRNEDSQLLAITTDSTFANAAWSEQEGFDVTILSDFWPHGHTARGFGVFDEKVGCPVRGTFLIDREGVVRWCVVNGIADARNPHDYRSAVAALSPV